jgi:hypothetical protein
MRESPQKCVLTYAAAEHQELHRESVQCADVVRTCVGDLESAAQVVSF